MALVKLSTVFFIFAVETYGMDVKVVSENEIEMSVGKGGVITVGQNFFKIATVS